MAPRVTQSKKIALLNLIKIKKSILFGRFSSDLDHREKLTAWTEVLLKAKSLEIVADNRDVAFVRDKVWGVWKSRTMEKRDNRNKTGTGGGKANVLTELDHLILEIIGTETVVINGLDVGESGRPVIATSSIDLEDDMRPQNSPFTEPIASSSTVGSSRVFATKRAHRSKIQNAIDQDERKRKRLQIELMEITIYKERLEALKLEKELQLPNSEYTKVLYD